MALEPGTRLGPYEIVSPLGAGGMGEVYKALDPRLGRHVAIKVLSRHLADSPDSIGRFEREARAVAALSHPNIVAIHDVGVSETANYVVTELLEGEPLRSVIRRGPLPWRKALDVCIAVCEGLSAAHAKGIIHRDLKPENLFLTEDGRLKILDFGLARVEATYAGHELQSSSKTAVHTKSGEVLGTVGYMSPEQLRGEVPDPRTDIFSLGCVLYEMIAGHRPFSRPTTAETLTAILRDEPPDVSQSGQSVPLEVSRAVLQCLAKSRSERVQSARDLALMLQTLLSSPEGTRTSVSRVVKQAQSLAVLPFSFPEGHQEAEHVADLLSLELISRLSSLPKVKVMSRSKTLRYRGANVDPQEVGRDLNVRAVIAGTILPRGGAFIVQAELVNVLDGSQEWGGQCRIEGGQDSDSVMAAAEEFTAAVREKLQGKKTRRPTIKSGAPAAAPPSAISSGHSLLSRANELLARGSDEAQKEAVSRLEDIVERVENASQSSAAEGKLAYAYVLLAWHGITAAPAVAEKARGALARAKDAGVAGAGSKLAAGVISAVFDWKWSESERLLRSAIAADSSLPEAHLWLGMELVATGRTAEGLMATERAVQLDPESITTALMASRTFYLAGQLDQALDHSRRALLADNNSIRARALMTLVHSEQGHPEEGIEQLQDLINEPDTSPEALAALGCAYAVAQKRGGASRMLVRLRDSRRRYTPPLLLAMVHSSLNEMDPALEQLELAFEQRSPALMTLAVEPRLRALRSQARFQSLVRRLALA